MSGFFHLIYYNGIMFLNSRFDLTRSKHTNNDFRTIILHNSLDFQMSSFEVYKQRIIL